MDLLSKSVKWFGAARNQLVWTWSSGKGYFKVRPRGSGKLMSVQGQNGPLQSATISEGTQEAGSGQNQQPSKPNWFFSRAVLPGSSTHSPTCSVFLQDVTSSPKSFSSGVVGTSIKVLVKLSQYLMATWVYKLNGHRTPRATPRKKGWAFSPTPKIRSGRCDIACNPRELLCDQQTRLH